MKKHRVLSGIQPSGSLHLGNYIGAVQNWVSMQANSDAFFCIVDYHAITVPQEPAKLREQIDSLVAMYVACGLDPKQVTLFKQSDVSAHTELGWILGTLANVGALARMTQFKDKAHKTVGKEVRESLDSADTILPGKVGFGLFAYPVLMAADILLYQPELVPVGEDQKQHIELTRDLAEKFNSRFGETFVIPETMQPAQGARIMSLDDPTKKMSKSATSEAGYIALTDTPDLIMKKIKRAVTDSGSEIVAKPDKPALHNLLTIFSVVSGKTIPELEHEFAGKGYGDFKQALAEAVVAHLEPIQERYNALMQDRDQLHAILAEGKAKAEVVANATLLAVKEKIGVL